MEIKSRGYARSRGFIGSIPWWFYLLMLAVFYLLGWVLHLAGIIPGR